MSGRLFSILMIGSRWLVGMETIAWKTMALTTKFCYNGDVDKFVK